MSQPQDLHRQAEKNLDGLRRLYDRYETASFQLQHANDHSVSRIGDWFRGSSRTVNHPLHDQFYAAVKLLISRLAPQLDDLAAQDPSAAADLAAQAVDVILNPVPDEERDVGGWMRFAAEPLCAPLLHHLPRARLQAIEEQYLRIYPKKRQFPNQKELYSVLHSLLRE